MLGSVKTNLGHLESAAGVAGFIKTVLSVYHGHIPKQLHFKRLTPHASEGASRFTIASQPMQWPSVDRARRAAVSSFGVSGTNAHVVIEQAPVTEPVAAEPEPAVSTLVVTGKTPERIASMAGRLAGWMEGAGAEVGLADVAHTLNHHRAQHSKFATVAACDRDAGGRRSARARRAVLGTGCRRSHTTGRAGRAGCSSIRVRVRSGLGWAGGCWPTSRRSPPPSPNWSRFSSSRSGFPCDRCSTRVNRWSASTVFSRCLVGVQLALTALWRSYGVHPDAVIGHSMGEVTAAVVAGALSAADGLKVIATRSRLMAGCPARVRWRCWNWTPMPPRS